MPFFAAISVVELKMVIVHVKIDKKNAISVFVTRCHNNATSISGTGVFRLVVSVKPRFPRVLSLVLGPRYQSRSWNSFFPPDSTRTLDSKFRSSAVARERYPLVRRFVDPSSERYLYVIYI